ncbi:MAG: hypothetical protein H7A23_24510 [Leptospiraceae bacterium]|nr:hypothetical protein [Leptospiraceae bacterium]MCP5497728.1 hypothetical protein [Leptospiraceae bacterium]
MLYLFIIVSLLFGCQKHPKNPFFFFPEDDLQAIQLTYGERNESSNNQSKEVVYWGPTYEVYENRICLKSHKGTFVSQEWGPTLQICFENSIESEALLETALERLKFQHTSDNRPEGVLKFEDSEAYFSFYTLSELTKKIRDATIQKAFIGDGTLSKELSKKIDLSSFYTTALSGGKSVETGFAAPYFSLFGFADFILVAFPTNNLTLTPRANHYLTIQLSLTEKIASQLEEFFAKIETENLKFQNQCQNLDLEPSEFFLSGSFPSKKYLEFYNPLADSPLCVKQYYIHKDDEVFVVQNPSGFVLPNATKLFIEESSPMQGIAIDSGFWSYIYRTNLIGVFSAQKNQEKITLPSEHDYKWEDNGFAFYPKNDMNCSSILQIYSGLDSLCGDPGIHSEIQKTDGMCRPQDFVLTETNPTGILRSEKIDGNLKFIELQYIGNSTCDPSSLKVKIDESLVPMFSSQKLVSPQKVILIGNSESFLNLPSIINRNIDSLNPNSKIQLTDSNNVHTLFSGLDENRFTITRDGKGTIHSLLPINGRWFHHPVYHSKHLYPEEVGFHYMSPGEIVNVQNYKPDNSEVFINEISWMGSYKGSEAVANDRFIELFTKNIGSLDVEIITDTHNDFFSFPVMESENFTVLSKQSLTCFPDVPTVSHTSFSLNTKDTTLKVYNTFGGNLITQIVYSPTLGHGFNSSVLKLRKSYGFSGFHDLYVNSSKSLFSSFITDNCLENTFATPGEGNEFEPFLVSDSIEGNLYHYYLIKSNKQEISSVKITHYNYDRTYQKEINVPVQKDEFARINVPVDSSWQDTLIYQSMENSSDIKLYNLDGLYIEALRPHPQNSQNEWVLLCNRGNKTIDISDYEIEDNASTDGITTYLSRKGVSLPSGLQAGMFDGGNFLITQGQCAYLLDPDASNITLQEVGNPPTLVLTTSSTSTIGNGISKTDTLDLFKWKGGNRIHIHSFGNKYSHSPFSITAELDEIIRLKEGKRGEVSSDYEVIK